MVADGTIDISPAEFTITKARSTVVDFLPALTESYQQLFIRNPADALAWTAYTAPFTPLCWVAIVLFVVLVPPVIAGIMLYGNFYMEIVLMLNIQWKI